MTYCIATKLNAGLVMLSDSRTNAGVDHIGTFRKMAIYEKPGDRVLTILSSGNLGHQPSRAATAGAWFWWQNHLVSSQHV